LCRDDTHRPDYLDFSQFRQNQSWPIALASRRGPNYMCSHSLTLAGTWELLKRSMGTDQRENKDLHSIKTVFHGSQQLKMKMERPSRPTRPLGVIAKWFLPCPHSQYTRPFTSAAARHCPLNPSPPPISFVNKTSLALWSTCHTPPPPHPIQTILELTQHPCLISLRILLQQSWHWIWHIWFEVYGIFWKIHILEYYFNIFWHRISCFGKYEYVNIPLWLKNSVLRRNLS
jgi:hypothetical protein